MKRLELNEAIQTECEILKLLFKAENDDKVIKARLHYAQSTVYNIIKETGDSKMEARLRTASDFLYYVKPGSDEERTLINLLRRMVEGQVPWEELFRNGTLLSSL